MCYHDIAYSMFGKRANEYMEHKWIGEVCDICGKSFTQTDDVAICPECGTPYHRSCIAQTGECVHTDWHEQGKEWQPKKENVSDVATSVTCPRCMSKNNKNARFCSHCGLQLSGANTAPSEEEKPPFAHGSHANGQRPNLDAFGDPQFIKRIVMDPFGGYKPDEQIEDGVTAREAAAYVKKNPNYFLPRFRLAKNRIPGLNFSAFLFGGLYYIYRKMYGMGTLLLLTQLILSVPAFILGIFYATEIVGITIPLQLDTNMISNMDMVCSFLRMGLMFLSGFMFNRVYRGHVLGKVKKLKTRFADPKQALQEISARGGVNFALILVLLVAYFSLYYAVIVSIVQVFGQ